MSLVVVEATENGPRIVSDTRVTFESSRPSFKTGTLKAIVVSRTAAICFAGDVVAGLDGVRHFAKRILVGATLDELLLELQARTANSTRVAEFLVAIAGEKPTISRVRGGTVERNLHSAWIGDQCAFEHFQAERLKPVTGFQLEMMKQLTSGQRAISILGQAMEAVIADPDIPSVNDFCVRIAATNGEFNYLPQTFIHVGRDININDGDNLIDKMAQPVEEGGYAVSVVEPARPGNTCLGPQLSSRTNWNDISAFGV